MFYIVGLGNPGEKYERTRHNVGRNAVETVAQSGSFSEWTKSKNANAFYAHGAIGEERVELILPETFMNKSGETVSYVVQKHGAAPSDFIVVHDEIDLPFGEIKIGKGRGSGGNNGVQSIIDKLGSKDFVRVRVGIAPKSFWTGKIKRPQGGGPLERYVLKPFTPKEQEKLEDIKNRVNAALEMVVNDGVEKAMNEYN